MKSRTIITPFQASFLIIILCLVAPSSTFAQKQFKGQLVYRISYEGSRIEQEEKQQLPARAEVIARKHQVRVEMHSPILRQVKIADARNKQVVSLLDIEGGKYAIRANDHQIEEQIRQMPPAEIIFTDEQRNILGHKCYKAIALIRDAFGEHQAEIWFTIDYDGYPLHFDTPYREIPGMMLSYQIRSGKLLMKYEAVSIQRKSVGKKNFKIPSAYRPITFEELRDRLAGAF